MGRALSFLVIATLLLGSCSLDYGNSKTKDTSEVPQTIMKDFRQTSVQNEREAYTVEGKRAETYEALKELRLRDFSFQEYDKNGNVSNKGFAENAIVSTDSNDAVVKGKLRGWSATQDVTLETSDLSWSQKEKTLVSTANAPVTLSKSDGSQITGRGLHLDFRTNEVQINGPLQGSWSTTKKENDAQQTPKDSGPTPVPTPVH